MTTDDSEPSDDECYPLTVTLPVEAFDKLKRLSDSGVFSSVDDIVEQSLALLETHATAFKMYMEKQKAGGRNVEGLGRRLRIVLRFEEVQ